MYTLQITYYELRDSDSTLIDRELIDSSGNVIGAYCSYDDIKQDINEEDLWQNQVEEFDVLPEHLTAIFETFNLSIYQPEEA